MHCFRSPQVQIGKWFEGTGITNHAHSQVSDPGCALPLILQGLERCTQPFVRGHWLDHTNTIMPAEIMYDTTQKVPQHPFAEQYVKTISPDHLWAKPGIMPLKRLWPLGHFRGSSWPPHWKPFWSPASLFQGFCTTGWLGLHLLKHCIPSMVFCIWEKLLNPLDAPQDTPATFCWGLPFFKEEWGILFQCLPFGVMGGVVSVLQGCKAPWYPLPHSDPGIIQGAALGEASNVHVTAQWILLAQGWPPAVNHDVSLDWVSTWPYLGTLPF